MWFDHQKLSKLMIEGGIKRNLREVVCPKAI